MKKYLLFLLVSLVICNVYAESSEQVPTDNQLKSRIDSVVHKHTVKSFGDFSNVGLSLGISVNNKMYLYNYGAIEKNKKQLPNSNTVYEIGSLTKTFTGILLAHAVRENKISLDDDIRDYLPGNFNNLEFNGTPIKVLHLANHTSGFPEDIIPEVFFTLKNPTMFDIVELFEGDTISFFLEGLKKFKPETLPGTKIVYSNTGMIALGIVLENCFKVKYQDLIKKYIADPLKMKNTETVYFYSDTANYTKGYDKQGNIMPHITFQIAGAAGGLKSTVHDMTKYVRANIHEKDKAIQLSHKKTIEINGQHVGLGWQFKTVDGYGTFLWHDGGEPGFSSYCMFSPEKKIGIVGLSNQRGRQYQLSVLSDNITNDLLSK